MAKYANITTNTDMGGFVARGDFVISITGTLDGSATLSYKSPRGVWVDTTQVWTETGLYHANFEDQTVTEFNITLSGVTTTDVEIEILGAVTD